MTLNATEVTWPQITEYTKRLPLDNFPFNEIHMPLGIHFVREEFLLIYNQVAKLCQKMIIICKYQKFAKSPEIFTRFFKKSDGLLRCECMFFENQHSSPSHNEEGVIVGAFFKETDYSLVFAKLTLLWESGVNELPVLSTEFNPKVINETEWGFLRGVLTPIE
jgi:hypothetical protein